MKLIKRKAICWAGLNWHGSMGFREALSRLISGELNTVCIQTVSSLVHWQLPFWLMFHNQNKAQRSVNLFCQQICCSNTLTAVILRRPTGIWEGFPLQSRWVLPRSYRSESGGSCQISCGTNNSISLCMPVQSVLADWLSRLQAVP